MEKFEVLLTGNGDSGLYRSLLSVFNLETPAKVLHVFVPHVRREAALNSLEMVRADTKQDGPQFRIHSLAFETRLEEFIEHVEEDKFCFLSENDMFLPDHSNIFNSLTTDIDLSLTSYWQRKKFGNFKIVHPKNGNEWIPLSAFAAKKENAIKIFQKLKKNMKQEMFMNNQSPFIFFNKTPTVLISSNILSPFARKF